MGSEGPLGSFAHLVVCEHCSTSGFCMVCCFCQLSADNREFMAWMAGKQIQFQWGGSFIEQHLLLSLSLLWKREKYEESKLLSFRAHKEINFRKHNEA